MEKKIVYMICVVSLLFVVLCGGCKGVEKETNMEVEETDERKETVKNEYTKASKSLEEKHEEDVFCLEPLEEYGMQPEKMSVTIPGLTREYHILFLSDLHIILENEEIAAQDKETVHSRVPWFSGAEDMTSAKYWEGLPQVLDACHANVIFWGGDMIDYCSTANIEWDRLSVSF